MRNWGNGITEAKLRSEIGVKCGNRKQNVVSEQITFFGTEATYFQIISGPNDICEENTINITPFEWHL